MQDEQDENQKLKVIDYCPVSLVYPFDLVSVVFIT